MTPLKQLDTKESHKTQNTHVFCFDTLSPGFRTEISSWPSAKIAAIQAPRRLGKKVRKWEGGKEG